MFSTILSVRNIIRFFTDFNQPDVSDFINILLGRFSLADDDRRESLSFAVTCNQPTKRRPASRKFVTKEKLKYWNKMEEDVLESSLIPEDTGYNES